MGCYISVVNDAGDEHPNWEQKLSRNRDYAVLYYSLPHKERKKDEALRPSDFPAWREAIGTASLTNRKAHLMLMDILEQDPQWWIRVSW